jgi:hypothetical protein
MLLIHRVILAFCLFLVPTLAAADCLYDGKQYAEGSRIGVLVCEGGHWVRR